MDRNWSGHGFDDFGRVKKWEEGDRDGRRMNGRKGEEIHEKEKGL